MTQKMNRHTFMFFLLYLCELHNNRELNKLKRGKYFIFHLCLCSYSITFVLCLQIKHGTGGIGRTHRIEGVDGTARIPWDCPTCPTWDRWDRTDT